MSNKEGSNIFFQCPIEKCGRKFEDQEKMTTHILRRHPENEGLNINSKQTQDKKELIPSQIQMANPSRKRSISKDTNSQIQQQQPVIIKKENNPSQSKERNDSISSSSSFSQQISTERSLSKEVTSSRLQQRPPTPKSSLSMKGQSGQSESMRRSQDLFRKTQEYNQLIEKTGQQASTSKEPTSRQQQQGTTNTNKQQQITLKSSKPLQKPITSIKGDQKSPTDSKPEDKNEQIKRQQSNIDQELIQSILLTINKAENLESAKNQNQFESAFPKEEVNSEGEDFEEGLSIQSSSKGVSRPSTANQQASSSEGLKRSQTDQQQQSDSRSVSSLNELKKQKQVSIQEILSCKKRITCEYLLENSSNQTNDIGFIETLTLNEQNLIVFEDGLTDVKFDLMVSLQYLSLSRNQLINIVSLSKFSTSLLELNINFNQIVDINPLYECVNLQKLWASHNMISSINCLKKLKNLKILSLFNNQITTYIDTLKELQNLEELDLADNPCSRDEYYKYDVLSAIKPIKLTKLDSSNITQQDIQISKTFANNKNNHSNNTQNRPGSAPLKINQRTGLSASMIVNNQIKEKQQNQQNNQIKDKIKQNLNKEKSTTSSEDYQKQIKLQELEKKLSEIQSRQQELKDQIRQTKKINKSIMQDIEEKEKENIVLREQSGQIEGIRQNNKSLMKKISAYESTLILHTEPPEELKAYIKSLKDQVQELKEKNEKLNQENNQLEEDFMDEDIDDQDSDGSDYNPEKINELLRRSTAAFSQIKQDLKMLNKAKK